MNPHNAVHIGSTLRDTEVWTVKLVFFAHILKLIYIAIIQKPSSIKKKYFQNKPNLIQRALKILK